MGQEETEEDSFELYKLRKRLHMLEKKKGYHTELVSLYIPPDKRISDVTNYLKQEYGQASNIKSKTTRKNVMDCIVTIQKRLSIIKQPPESGMVIFCGAIPQMGPGTEKIEVYPIVPPPGRKINIYKYHCASEFFLEPLRDLLVEKSTFGIVAMDRSGASIATIKGNELTVIENMTSGIQGKHRAGGQSQRRFERLIEQQAHEFFQRLGEHMNNIFVPLIDEGVSEGVIIGGAGPTKDYFAKSDFFDYRIRDRLLLVVDTGYSDITGIREIIEKSEEHLKGLRYLKEKKIIQKFLGELARDTGMVTYGEKQVRSALERAAVDVLLLSENVSRLRVIVRCPNCDHTFEKTLTPNELDNFEREISEQSCEKCDSSLLNIDEVTDIIEELGELAQSTGAKVEIISPDTEEGNQLWSGFGGIAALLRYKIEE
jgi:peptide chain release factor subunit 1